MGACMSRIVAVAKAMFSNPNKISSVINVDSYWFFLYGNKFAWCIQNLGDEGKNRYRLFFIKVENEFAVNNIKQFEIVSRQDIDSLVRNGEAIEYDSYEVDSKEIIYNFGLLYSVVKEKSIGIDKVFNEILEV
jgi:hypothetical protein